MCLDDGVDPLGHDAIRGRHLRDLLEDVALALFALGGRVAARGPLSLLHGLL